SIDSYLKPFIIDYYYTTNFTWIVQIKNILRLSEKTTPAILHALYLHYPCEISGIIIINNERFEITINAASFIYGRSEENAFCLGCSDEKCKDYFLSHPESPR
ncbi:MAG: hypothetical protein AAFU64_15225, partial [Bacteroidota bacterium]